MPRCAASVVVEVASVAFLVRSMFRGVTSARATVAAATCKVHVRRAVRFVRDEGPIAALLQVIGHATVRVAIVLRFRDPSDLRVPL